MMNIDILLPIRSPFGNARSTNSCSGSSIQKIVSLVCNGNIGVFYPDLPLLSVGPVDQGEQLKADLIVYGAIASAYEKASQWRQALRLLVEVEGARLETDVVMHNEAAWTNSQVHSIGCQNPNVPTDRFWCFL